jgi:hypothetical protein
LNQECSLQARREILRDAIGDEWNLLWSAGVLQIEKEDDYTTIIDRIGTHIRARRNPLLDRKEFHERNQLEGESIDSYYAALQMISESCSFEEDILSSFICERCDSSVQHVCDGCKEPVEIVKKLRDFTLRDRLIYGLKEEYIQKEVLKEKLMSLTLKRTLEICQALEASKETRDKLQANNAEICRVQIERNKSEKNFKKPQHRKSNYRYESIRQKSGDCWKCGKQHGRDIKCPAAEEMCSFCKKTGHFSSLCWSRSSEEEHKTNHVIQIRGVQRGKCRTLPCVTLRTSIANQSKDLDWILDTGAEVNIIGEEHLKQFEKVKRQQSRSTLKGFNTIVAQNCGTVNIALTKDEKLYTVTAYFVERCRNTIIRLSEHQSIRVCFKFSSFKF